MAPPAGPHPLEPDRATLASWIDTFTRAALDHLDGLASGSAAGRVGPEGTAIGDAVSRPIPEEPFAGGAPELAALVMRSVEGALNTAGPGLPRVHPGRRPARDRHRGLRRAT